MRKRRETKKTGRRAGSARPERSPAQGEDYEAVFRDFLQEKGLKLTRERKVILEEVFRHDDHFDIDEFYLKIKQKGLKVSRASIYRTLPLLLECGLVDEVKTTERQAFYEHIHGRRHHDHLVCLSCGKVIEFYSPAIERLQEEICRRRRFKSLRHVLEIQGHCKDCASA
ncbi:MAG: transcriptional repressor [Nitrospirae bacterium]|nr:transcriptional repressor [Nitrospirota bacterium]